SPVRCRWLMRPATHSAGRYVPELSVVVTVHIKSFFLVSTAINHVIHEFCSLFTLNSSNSLIFNVSLEDGFS
ncbi:TPA: hypothetical protein ACJHG5_004239, partial [Klebsiella pneumoniae]